MKIALLGCGYWGGVLLSKLIKMEVFRNITILAKSDAKRGEIVKQSDKIIFTTNDNDVFSDDSIKYIFIALPAIQHYRFAKKGLMNAKDVFIEKPMTTNYDDAIELTLLADALGRVLMVDHTFLYTSQLRKIKEILLSGSIGDLKYYDSSRVSLGNVQRDVNVIWDLAIHDLAILDYLINEEPVSVSATSGCVIFSNIISDARITLFYQSGFIAHIRVSWNFPEKIRHIFIGGSEKVIRYDDASSNNKVRIYDSSYHIGTDDSVRYKNNGYTSENSKYNDALESAIDEFVNCCENRCEPLSNGLKASKYIKILEKIDISIKNNGKEVLI